MTSILNDYIMNLNYGDETDDQTTPKSLIVAKNGIFVRSKGQYFETVSLVDDIKNSKLQDMLYSAKLPELTESFKIIKEIPKVPAKAMKAVLNFYRWTYETKSTEAQVNFYWDEKGVITEEFPGLTYWGNEIYSYTPIQKNTSVLTDADDDEKYHWLRENTVPFLETHSHHTMEAFMSPTDYENSHIDGLQLVFGHIKSENFMMHAWVTNVQNVNENVDDELILQFVDFPTDVFENYKNGKLINSDRKINLYNYTNDSMIESNNTDDETIFEGLTDEEINELTDEEFENYRQLTLQNNVNDTFIKNLENKFPEDWKNQQVKIKKPKQNKSFNNLFKAPLPEENDNLTSDYIEEDIRNPRVGHSIIIGDQEIFLDDDFGYQNIRF